jgi:hypothetical protein
MTLVIVSLCSSTTTYYKERKFQVLRLLAKSAIAYCYCCSLRYYGHFLLYNEYGCPAIILWLLKVVSP